MENPKRDNRQKVANIVLENNYLFQHLVTLTFNVNDKISIKAAWVLEWICTHYYLEWILPYFWFKKNLGTYRIGTPYSNKNNL